MTSSQARVFNPQSGLTQRFSTGRTATALRSRLSISDDIRNARRVNIPDSGSNLIRISESYKGFEKLHVRSRRLDRDHVCIESRDRFDDVIKLTVTHVSMDLRFIANTGRGKAKRFDGPLEVGWPIASAQGQPFPQRRFIDLNDLDAGGFQIENFIADCQSDLPRGLAARLVITDKAPLENGDRAGKHAFHWLGVSD